MGRVALPVILEKDPAGHAEQRASEDRVAPGHTQRAARFDFSLLHHRSDCPWGLGLT
jgi:hypothetical protein